MTYFIKYSKQARADLADLFDVIANSFKAPITAQRYLQGLKDKIETLKSNPDFYAIRTNPSFSRYNKEVRRINYKKMAILYSVFENHVFIHRIIPASMIID